MGIFYQVEFSLSVYYMFHSTEVSEVSMSFLFESVVVGLTIKKSNFFT